MEKKSARQMFEDMNGGASTDAAAEGGDAMPGAAEVEASTEVVLDADQANAGGDPAADPAAAEGDPAAAAAEGAPVEELPAEELPAEDAGAPAAEDQAEASWRGRLEAREAELKAREDALLARESGGSLEVAEETAPDEVAADRDTARGRLSDDFTPETVNDLVELIKEVFVEMFEDAAGSLREQIGTVGGTQQRVIDAVAQSFDDMYSFLKAQHVAAVKTAHPDWEELASGPYWDKYVASLAEPERADALQIRESGTWAEAIRMIGEFKDWVGAQAKLEESGKQAPLDGDGLDAEAGVRSSSAVRPATEGAAAGMGARALFNQLNGISA